MGPEKTAFTGFSANDPAPLAALWLGPGTLFEGLGPVLEVLAAAGGERGANPSIESLGDLDRLLDAPPASGRLLLEVEGLPAEDVGLVKRFLRRHGGWSLVLCGGDPRDSTVRALTADGHTSWLAWPPDLDQMRALVGGASPNGRAPAPSRSSARGPEVPARPAGDLPRAAAAGAAPPLDLGELVEELLASAALDEDPPQYVYRADGDLGLHHAADDVAGIVDAVLSVARACGGEGAEIDVDARPADGDAVELVVAFPEGPLAGLGVRRTVDPGAVGERVGEAEGQALGRAAEALERLGGSARAARPASGRLELTFTLPRG